jgi:hypothetical protein
MLKFLDAVPHKYKVGPWSPVTHLVILSYLGFILLSMLNAFNDYTTQDYASHPNGWIQWYRLVFALYGIATSALVFRDVGIWPLLSYTLTSWNLMTLRLLTSYLAGAGFESMEVVADVLRFPALAGCSITVSIWWLVLVPIIDHLVSKDKDGHGRAFFWKWNLSPMLLNVHLLNLPIVAVEFLVSKSALTFFDLWVALLVALGYCMLYLNVLDPRGLHFYIIFTPRTAWCAVSYVLVLTAYYVFYQAWNHVLAMQLL